MASIHVSDQGWAEGWVSPEVIDHSGEFIPVDAWDLTLHKSNPVAFVNHDNKGPIVGKWENAQGQYTVEKRPGGLWGRLYFDMGSEVGREEYRKYKEGFKRAFSPGFMAKAPVNGTVGGKPAKIIRNCRLFEISTVGLPDNPSALRIGVKHLATQAGNTITPIPPGFFYRKGLSAVTNETTVVEPTGFAAYLKALNERVALFGDLRTVLTENIADETQRSLAYGLLQPVYKGLHQFVAHGKTEHPDADWQSFEKSVSEAFAGHEVGPGPETTVVPGLSAEQVQAIVAEAVKPLRQEIENHDAAIGALGDAVETLVAA